MGFCMDHPSDIILGGRLRHIEEYLHDEKVGLSLSFHPNGSTMTIWDMSKSLIKNNQYQLIDTI
jgi:hypothetical protein